MSWDLEAQARIAKELSKINENLQEQNRLIAEVLKYLLRNES